MCMEVEGVICLKETFIPGKISLFCGLRFLASRCLNTKSLACPSDRDAMGTAGSSSLSSSLCSAI